MAGKMKLHATCATIICFIFLQPQSATASSFCENLHRVTASSDNNFSEIIDSHKKDQWLTDHYIHETIPIFEWEKNGAAGNVSGPQNVRYYVELDARGYSPGSEKETRRSFKYFSSMVDSCYPGSTKKNASYQDEYTYKGYLHWVKLENGLNITISANTCDRNPRCIEHVAMDVRRGPLDEDELKHFKQ
ncbi:hypothetical protein [Magnetospirillum molischianum]|uniref:hypothetical protein n=1 Tax=Magnetospirillum molischianum TaxID=1083 RepID=UPI0012DD1AAA|nr:hypothetical protein [Magnetospirillum molischianum]